MHGSIENQNPCDFVLFGTLGDLACRKLLPALYHLEQAKLLAADTRIIGCAQDNLSLANYIDFIKKQARLFLADTFDEQIWSRLQARLHYCSLDLTQLHNYPKLLDYVNFDLHKIIAYFAIPPSLYIPTCLGLSQLGLNKSPTTIVLEKPIGHDLISSQEINNQVACYFTEEQIYRIDHYLGKETVLNLLALRFANPIFSSNWDYRFIDNVKITLAEKIGVEKRWDYYNQSGQVRDMLQNHVLQILSLITMEPPLDLSAENIRSEKLKVLKSLRMFDAHNIQEYTIRAQYIRNELDNESIPGYLEEAGANQDSQTETFVAVKAFIDNWRWSGVPFYLTTGKRLAKKQSEVVINFKAQPHDIFPSTGKGLAANQLIIRLQPDEGIEMRITNKIPGLNAQMALQDGKLDLSFNSLFHTQRIPDAYECLLLQIMLGKQYLFVSRQEIEQAWAWIDSIKTGWATTQAPLYYYTSGSWGPDEIKLLFK